MNALDLALANAAANAPKGEELHLENLDSIADPSSDEPKSTLTDFQLNQLKQDSEQYWANRPAVVPEPLQYDSRDVAFKGAYLVNDPHQDGLLLSAVKSVEARCDAIYNNTNFRLNHISTDIKYILETITAAAQSMSSEPNLKHRSLHEWDDSTLLNELVERENDLMPFYYELLKRIGSPELQGLVMSSMQGKNNSMVTLAQLCAAMGSAVVQAQPQRVVEQTYPVTQGNYQSTIANTVVPQQQYFGQAAEEYIRQTNNR